MIRLSAMILVLASLSQGRTFPQAPQREQFRALKSHRSELKKNDLNPLIQRKSPVKLTGKRFETRKIKK